MKLLLVLAACLLLQGCNSGVALSLFGDLVQLRMHNEIAGKPHIEDVFKSEEER